jgi:acyl-CoA thioester hydrolase
MGACATVSTRVAWMDTDAAGQHHNTAITRYVEAAEAELIRSLGLVEYFGRAPRVRQEVDHEAPLLFGQEVTATVRVERVGRSSITFGFEVWGEPFADRPRVRSARGLFVAVHVPVAGSGAQPWPTEWAVLLSD